MENDYFVLSKKEYVDNILRNNGFYVDYAEQGGWGPCYPGQGQAGREAYISFYRLVRRAEGM